MKKSLFTLLLIGGIVASSNAQTYELEWNESSGYIINTKGKKVVGYTKRNGDDNYPWANQNKVKYFDEKATEDGKVKNKEMEKYGPKDIKGYSHEGKYFESQKYSNMSAVGPDMLPKWYFIQVLVDGKMSIYKYYETPLLVGETSTVEADKKRVIENPHIIIAKEGSKKTEKLKRVNDVDILEYISDCEIVKAKYLAGDYGIKPADNEEKEGLKGFASRLIDANRIGGFIEEIAIDYNQNCK